MQELRTTTHYAGVSTQSYLESFESSFAQFILDKDLILPDENLNTIF